MTNKTSHDWNVSNRYRCGIDPGVKTGLAVWDLSKKALVRVSTENIILAQMAVVDLHESGGVEVWFEDARKRTWFGGRDANQAKYGAGVREGAGSIKRECGIWEEFCCAHGIKFKSVKPASGATKWSAETFRRITGWEGRTSVHARDAAVLVFGGG